MLKTGTIFSSQPLQIENIVLTYMEDSYVWSRGINPWLESIISSTYPWQSSEFLQPRQVLSNLNF